MNILIEGWRGINHSFSLVNQWQIIELLKTSNIYFKDVPFISDRWNKKDNSSGFENNIENLIINNQDKSFGYLKKYRKWLYLNIDIRDHHLFMLFSSVILYVYGLRECNDLDLYVDALLGSFSTKCSAISLRITFAFNGSSQMCGSCSP